MTREELGAWLAEAGEARYRADQIFAWIHRYGITDFEGMTNLSRDLRGRLAQKAQISSLVLDGEEPAEDGTEKVRFRLNDGQQVESVWIPGGGDGRRERNTICVSTQAGCAMGCEFCHTATMKLLRNLTAAEIVDQVIQLSIRHAPAPLTNLVMMGMGEPLHNYDAVARALRILMDDFGVNLSHRRITLSTVGLIPELERLGRELPVNLAVSLHAASDELRSTIVPANRKYPVADLIDACRRYPMPTRKRVTFEYVQLPGVNDRPRDVVDLKALLRDLPCKLNLIPFNPFPGAPFRAPTGAEVEDFERRLGEAGFHVLVRRPRGRDVLAACGQLATEGRRRKAVSLPVAN